MRGFETVGIVGLGLIGGSLARALTAFRTNVIGYDADRRTLNAAKSAGIVSKAAASSLAEFSEADVIVLAVPVDASPAILRKLEPHAGKARLVTDVGSTKAGILAAAERSPLAALFVGSHPMAGDHRGGWNASRPNLFHDATVYLCRTTKSSPDAFDVAQLFWSSVGGTTVEIGAEEHDELVAWSSHMPHMLSTALALALAERGIRRTDLGGGGRDMTRIAAGAPDLWAAIARENSSSIDTALAAIETELSNIRTGLREAKGRRLAKLLEKAANWAREDAGRVR